MGTYLYDGTYLESTLFDYTKPFPIDKYMYMEITFERSVIHGNEKRKIPIDILTYSEAKTLNGGCGTPRIDLILGDYVYCITIDENPKELSAIPKQYKQEVEKVKKYISLNYNIFIDHWNEVLDDCELFDALSGNLHYKVSDGEKYIN